MGDISPYVRRLNSSYMKMLYYPSSMIVRVMILLPYLAQGYISGKRVLKLLRWSWIRLPGVFILLDLVCFNERCRLY